MKTYSAYKSAEIKWLESVPEHWQVKPLFAVLRECQESNKGNVENNVLSLSYGKIIRRDLSQNFGLLPESFETYQIVHPGNIILRLTDLQNDKRSLRVGLVKEKGIITSAYIGLEPTEGIDSNYAYYLLHSYDLVKVFYNEGAGVRQSMTFKDLRRLPILLPPLPEQQAIADFLDRKTAQIDRLIAKKQRQIKLLQEQCTALINQAVTKGLNPDVPMKDSGIEWLGEIPSHWELPQIHHLARVVRGQTPRPAGDPRFFDGDFIPWITVGEATKDANMYLTKTRSMLTQEGSRHSIVFDKGTFILTNSGATLGVPKILAITGCMNDGNAALLEISDEIAKEYLYFFFTAITKILRERAQISGQPNLNTTIISGILIPKPPKNEQQQIVKLLVEQENKFSQVTKNLTNEIGLLQEYRTALISEAVTGKIDVREKPHG